MNTRIHLLEDAVSLLVGIPSHGTFADLTDYLEAQVQAFLPGYGDNPYDVERIRRLIPTDIESEQVAENLFIVYTLIYFFSGQYPDDIWGEDVLTGDSVMHAYRRIRADYLSDVSALDLPSGISRHLSKSLDGSEDFICGSLTRRFLDVSHMQCANIAEDLTLAAILKEAHFIPKVATPARWIDRLQQEADRLRQLALITDLPAGVHRTGDEYALNEFKEPETVRVLSSVKLRGWQLHAMSVKGANQAKCDDFSMVCTFEGCAWFACVADGIGSAPLAHVGSRVAAEVLRDILERAYRAGGNPFSRQRDPRRGGLMHFIQYDLARHVSILWRRRLSAYFDNLPGADTYDFHACASTLLFSFGCPDFIACGMLGDGKFIVEKKKKGRDGETRYGYFFLTDGYSDVVSNGVLHMEHLRQSPDSMHIAFFKPSEISGILMATDGANALEYRNIGGILHAKQSSALYALPTMDMLRNGTYDECAARLRDLCIRFSASNLYSGGRGDDCSMVYVSHHFKLD